MQLYIHLNLFIHSPLVDTTLCPFFFFSSVLSNVAINVAVNVFWSPGAEISLLSVY